MIGVRDGRGVRMGVALAGLAAALASCAPHRVEAPRLDLETRRARYERALAARAARAAGVEEELSLWARTSSAADLPGVQARLLVVAPAAFRLRVASAFGVALDLSAEGDTLTAYSPRERLAMRVERAGDSLGLFRPGLLGARLWSAAWNAPAAAWTQATPHDSLVHLRWREASDTLEVEVGSGGLPVSVILRAAERPAVRVRYLGWMVVEGVSWPSSIDMAGGNGEWKLAARVHRIRFVRRPPPERLRVRVPADAERLTASDLRRAVERLGRF